jgi:hypothetical protein
LKRKKIVAGFTAVQLESAVYKRIKMLKGLKRLCQGLPSETEGSAI